MKPDLLTAGEVAALLKAPVSWVYARTGGDGPQLPYYKLGRLLRFSGAEIESWLVQQHRNRPKPSGSAAHCGTGLLSVFRVALSSVLPAGPFDFVQDSSR
jgi:predicted DNA-binding transcriptional regulator AlpA